VSAADPTELSDDELDRETHALWAQVHAAMGRAVALQVEINRRGLWNRWGAKGPGHWLSWRAGVSLREPTPCAGSPAASRSARRPPRRWSRAS
jgi:hypothetical protein